MSRGEKCSTQKGSSCQGLEATRGFACLENGHSGETRVQEPREEWGRKRTSAGPKSIRACAEQGAILPCSRFVSEMDCGG